MTAPRAKAEYGPCRACRYFEADPMVIEADVPGLAVLGSGHAASRAEDGLCVFHGRYLRGTASCPAFAPKRPRLD